ncbi:MAG TPA: fumarylacetoacetate hydrolase family protein [Rhizomicrobium sp.]|jgi:2-keto-4-pentenoate hydratase/2-oxohepta-3-ene-1,7-dioic acid hydratase in catechol pathway|nr:fumarylacetoacetate hydrolase family protein [Rhizomicrobium sp.]
MKLATFNAGSGADELGIVDGDTIVSISRAAPQIASSMIDLIARWSDVQHDVRAIARDRDNALALSSVELKAPIARPGKILAIGLNYADHIAESKVATPENQVWFAKMPTSVNAPFRGIQIPKIGPFVDYEAELVAVIGKGGRHVSKDDAPAAVFGYCCGNDVTERMWQHRTPQWTVGKSFDTHAPIGPWIVTADEVPDPHALGIRCIVNGETRQNSNTRHLVFNLWDQIAHLSDAMTLEPGDLLFTGTPGGVGAAMEPRRFLKPGDVVRVEIDSLGAIEATCVAEG